MVFQPFGFHFEVSSTSSPAEVKSSIRSKCRRFFDPKNGARGWIVGPLICLWFSAFDKHGPMLFGIISQDINGTRIRGRAGSDINGVLAFTLFIPIMLCVGVAMSLDQAAWLGQWNILGFVFLVGGALIYWIAHKDRRDAEPLVRFLKNALLVKKSAEMRSIQQQMRNGLTLLVNGEISSIPLSREIIKEALLCTGADDFIVLEESPEYYIQTIGQSGGYVVEMRKGCDSLHFAAIRRHSSQSLKNFDILTFDEAMVLFTAYASATEIPASFSWAPINRTR